MASKRRSRSTRVRTSCSCSSTRLKVSSTVRRTSSALLRSIRGSSSEISRFCTRDLSSVKESLRSRVARAAVSLAPSVGRLRLPVVRPPSGPLALLPVPGSRGGLGLPVPRPPPPPPPAGFGGDGAPAAGGWLLLSRRIRDIGHALLHQNTGNADVAQVSALGRRERGLRACRAAAPEESTKATPLLALFVGGDKAIGDDTGQA